MKKYVAIIFLDSSVIEHEYITTVITISESNLKKLGEEFVIELWKKSLLSIGRILSSSVRCYSYGEFSTEKSSEFNLFVEKEIVHWNNNLKREMKSWEKKMEARLERSKQSELK